MHQGNDQEGGAQPVIATPPPLPEPEPAPLPKKPKAAEKPRKKPTKGLSDKLLTHDVIPAGEYIFHEGEEGAEAFLLLSGEVEIRRRMQKEEVVIAHAGPGSIIGEMSLIDSEPRMASAKTVTETEVTVIPIEEMQVRLERLEKFDPVLHRLMGMFVKRMREYKVIDIG